MIQGFEPAIIVLEHTVERSVEIRTILKDLGGKSLEVFITTSNKQAGKKAVFFVKNIVINNTAQ